MAYEAELHSDGSVKRRLNHRESIARRINQPHLQSFPTVAANQRLQSAKVSRDATLTVSNESNFRPIRRPNRFSTIVVTAIVLVIFAWSMQSLYLSEKQTYKSITNKAADDDITNLVPATLDNKSNVKQIAETILGDNDWNDNRIEAFLNSWNQLNESSTQEILHSQWYELFSAKLKQKIISQPGIGSNQNKANDSELLLTLALVTGILNSENQTAAAKTKYNKLLDEIAKEISQAEQKSKLATVTAESEATLNEQLKKQYSYVPEPIRAAPIAEKPKLTPVSQMQQVKISSTDITATLQEYKKMYESGNADALKRLFAAATPNSKSINQHLSSLKTIFKNSSNRSINFYESKWELNNDTASMTTKINSSIEFNRNKGTQYSVAKAKLNFHKENNTVVITDFSILDRRVSVIPGNNKPIPVKQPKNPKENNNIPTSTDLQNITSQLITSYESGDLQKFLSILSKDIKTNDRTNIAGVKQDYQELFSSTAGRQMYLQNMKWTNESVGAKGTGDMKVIISGKDGNAVYTMTGKIQIVAQKFNDKVLITHLYHIERAK